MIRVKWLFSSTILVSGNLMPMTCTFWSHIIKSPRWRLCHAYSSVMFQLWDALQGT
jgi:hypothetical protein